MGQQRFLKTLGVRHGDLGRDSLAGLAPTPPPHWPAAEPLARTPPGGLRRRVGLGAWPPLRRVESDLVAQLRQRLRAARFDRVFADGSGLSQGQAVAIVRDQRGTETPAP
jgi:hypothetical protein